MTSDIALVSGLAADIESVMPVMDTAFDPRFGEAWTRGQCLGILSLPDVWLTLAKLPEGRVCGFTLARRTLDEAELLLLAVEPVSRGQGIGRALVGRCAVDAFRRGARKLMLEMRDGNSAGMLYESIGFAIIGRRKAYYRGHDGRLHDALTMRLPLSEGASFATSEALQPPKSNAS